MKRASLLFSTTILLAIHAASARANEAQSAIGTLYDLIADKDDIGDISIKRSQNGSSNSHRYLYEETISAKTSSFWGSWEMMSTGKIVRDKKGLLSLDYKIKENDANWHIVCSRSNQELWCGTQQVKTQEEKEDDGVMALAAGVAAQAIPYAQETITALSVLDEKQKEEGGIRIAMDSFDVTSDQLPSFFMEGSKESGRGTVRVFDYLEAKIETYLFEELKQEQIEVNGKMFGCRVFKMTNPQKESTYWFAEDGLGAFVVKESGKDADGPYEINLKQYTELGIEI